MAFRISSQQLEQLRKWADAAPDREICGLILDQSDTVKRLELADNVADFPERHFEIDPRALIAAERQARSDGLSVLGYFHSHPTGSSEPSASDASQAAADGRVWLIIGQAEVRAWRSVAEGTVHGRFNPVELHVIDQAGG